jgi:hypothetical protein
MYFCDIKLKVMKTVSLKIDDSIFNETVMILSRLKIPRNRYINEAIDNYNRVQKRQILEKKIKSESTLVKNDSLSILHEFEKLTKPTKIWHHNWSDPGNWQ